VHFFVQGIDLGLCKTFLFFYQLAPPPPHAIKEGRVPVLRPSQDTASVVCLASPMGCSITAAGKRLGSDSIHLN
jgi:hypothetical protein